MFRKLRIAILLLVLATVALSEWRERSRATDWHDTLRVAIYPIAGDDSAVTRDTLGHLNEQDFDATEAFFQRHAHDYGIDLPRPVHIALAPEITAPPPAPPWHGNALQIAGWSLQLRWWAWRHDEVHGPRPQIRLFVVYHDPARGGLVPDSLGLQQGRIGIAHVYATRALAARNQVVLAHELAHTLGASDKYDPATDLPRYPDGYAEPQRVPLYPQHMAELMGGRTPVTDTEARIPARLDEVVIGPATAREIGLLTPASR